jgi:hypothetical protein
MGTSGLCAKLVERPCSCLWAHACSCRAALRASQGPGLEFGPLRPDAHHPRRLWSEAPGAAEQAAWAVPGPR